MRILKEVVEHTEHPGFYTIPGFSKYVISKDCKVINLTRPDKKLLGYKKIKGYVSFSLIDDDGNKRTIGAHRLLAITFLECPGHPDDYVPNHIDEDPSNNVLDNIEWLTMLDNIRYSSHKEKKAIPVQVRNLESDSVRTYETISHAARDFNVHVSSIRYRCELGNRKLFNGYQFRYVDNPWVTPDIDSGVEKRILLRNAVTNKVMLFHSQRDCAEYLGLAEATLSTYLARDDDQLLPGIHVAKRYSANINWPTYDDPELTYYKSGLRTVAGKTVGIVVTEFETSKRKFYSTAKEAALDNNLKPTTLNWRLKKSPDTVHSDGKMYAYV